MKTVKFYWSKGDSTGGFSVKDKTIEKCIQVAKEEAEKNGYELTEWYEIESK